MTRPVATPTPQRPRPRATRWGAAAALVLIVAAGTTLRLVPRLRDPASAMISDAAFHLRMTGETAERGRIPDVDSTCNAPQGRVLRRLLPDGFYPLAAGFHRLRSAMGAKDRVDNASGFLALVGGLIALPVFGATWALFRHRGTALAAALLAVALPAHLHRTWCYWFRYEALGALLLTTHVALAIGALTASRRRTSLALGAASGIALLGALWVWRVSFMFPILETGFVIGLTLLRPPGRAVREWFTIIVLFGSLACLSLGYLREQSFLLSRGWLAAIATGFALWTPWLRRETSRWGTRAIVLAGALSAAVLAGGLVRVERQYANVLGVLARRIASGLGFTVTPPPPMESLNMAVEELAGSRVVELFGPGGLSWLGFCLVLSPAVFWIGAGRPPLRRLRDLAAAPALLGFLCVALTFISLWFVRNKVLLAPIAAIVLGGLLTLALRRPAAAARKGKPAPGSRGLDKTLRVAVLATLAICTAVTIKDAVTLAATRTSRLAPGLAEALEYLRSETPARATVLSTWERGYEIQTYGERRTVVDGLLEDPEVQRRLPEIASALLQRSADSLAAVCRRYGSEYLLVPPSTYLLAVVLTAPPPLAEELDGLRRKLQASRSLTPIEADRVLIQMMVLGASPAPFEKVFERWDYRVYRLVGAAP